MSDLSLLFWAVGGAMLGFSYTFSVQAEITRSQKTRSNILRASSIHSIARVLLCSAVIIAGIHQNVRYGIVCLIFFLFFKTLFLFILVKRTKNTKKD
jgi:divalent metal cation (Fe/Co/Zn/Cd) transporter